MSAYFSKITSGFKVAFGGLRGNNVNDEPVPAEVLDTSTDKKVGIGQVIGGALVEVVNYFTGGKEIKFEAEPFPLRVGPGCADDETGGDDDSTPLGDDDDDITVSDDDTTPIDDDDDTTPVDDDDSAVGDDDDTIADDDSAIGDDDSAVGDDDDTVGDDDDTVGDDDDTIADDDDDSAIGDDDDTVGDDDDTIADDDDTVGDDDDTVGDDDDTVGDDDDTVLDDDDTVADDDDSVVVYPSAADLPGALYTQAEAETFCDDGWDNFTDLIDAGAVVDPAWDYVTSEGQCWALELAVQDFYDDPIVFEEVWEWTNLNMRSATYPPLLAWTCEPPDCVTGRDEMPAPDADLSCAVALFQASEAWGDGAYPFDYSVQATELADAILADEVNGSDYLLFYPGSPMVSPDYNKGALFRYLAEKTVDTRWLDIAEVGYDLMFSTMTVANGNTTNGLIPEICALDGSAYTGWESWYYYGYGSVRAPMYAAQDALAYPGEEPRATELCDMEIGTFFAPMVSSFGDGYELDGTQISPWHSESWVGFLAAGSMGTTLDSDKVDFYNELISTPYPTDIWRYYSIMGMNFGCLMTTGNWRLE